jgi:hypothetical protein
VIHPIQLHPGLLPNFIESSWCLGSGIFGKSNFAAPADSADRLQHSARARYAVYANHADKQFFKNKQEKGGAAMMRSLAMVDQWNDKIRHSLPWIAVSFTIMILFAGSGLLTANVVDFVTQPASMTPTPPNPMMDNPPREDSIHFDNFFQSAFEGWSIDYRARQLQNSFTSYEFGVPESIPGHWTPLSKLDFDLDSTWHGLQIERRTENTDLRFEWLTPMGNGINGNLNDYDWEIPGADFTDLGITRQRWTDGQMLNLNLEYRLLDHLFVLPVEFWLSGGFRWQRFNITGYDLSQVKFNNVWLPTPLTDDGDVITFNQQYYTEYIGGEFRTTLDWIPALPLELRLGGDYGGTQAYNVDHHLLRTGDRYTMESTAGDTLHYSASAEIQLRKNLSIGAQYDQLFIRTQGHHRLLNESLGVDETWDNGVRVQSNQSWFTLYLRFKV